MFLRMICRSSPADWSLTNFPLPSSRPRTSKAMSSIQPVEYIEIAQVVATQLSISTLNHSEDSSDPDLFETSVVDNSVALLRSILKQALGSPDKPVQQDPLSNAAIDSVVAPLKASKFQPKPVARREKASADSTSTRMESSTAIFAISAPKLRLQKGKAAWEFLPSVTTFWDTLQLSPSHGAKHIKALCVFPENKLPANKVSYFMEALHRTWTRDRLGSHEMLQTQAITDGLIPVNISSAKMDDSAMEDYSEQFLNFDSG